MNIKQRRWLSSERKLFSLPLIFGPTLSQSIFTIHSSLTQLYPFTCSLGIYNMMLVRETEPAQTKSINIPLACISLNILTMCYQSVAFVSLQDLFCNVLRVSPAPQFIIIQKVPCVLLYNWGQGVQIQWGKGISMVQIFDC